MADVASARIPVLVGKPFPFGEIGMTCSYVFALQMLELRLQRFFGVVDRHGGSEQRGYNQDGEEQVTALPGAVFNGTSAQALNIHEILKRRIAGSLASRLCNTCFMWCSLCSLHVHHASHVKLTIGLS